MKKDNESLEFKKFIKSFYQSVIQLNKSEYFILQYNGNDFDIYFPSNKNFKLYGKINLDNAPLFKEWLSKDTRPIKIINSELDLLRKAKVSDVLNLIKTDDDYEIEFKISDENKQIIFHKDDFQIEKIPSVSFIKSIDLDLENYTDDILSVYEEDDTLKVGVDLNKNILFEYVMDEIEVVFKPIKIDSKGNSSREKANYKFYISDLDESGIRIVMIEGVISNCCSLQQFFQVI